MEKPRHLFVFITALTSLFLASEILFLLVDAFAKDAQGVIYTTLINRLGSLSVWNLSVTLPLIEFLAAQLLTYCLYIYLLWYTTITIQNTFDLKNNQSTLVAFTLWAISLCTILLANAYYVPLSFFAGLLQSLTTQQVGILLIIFLSALLFITILTIACLCASLYQKKHLLRHALFFLFTAILVITNSWPPRHQPVSIHTAATATKPNIFIVGFDALRPDYLHHLNKKRNPTPHFDNFLQSSTVFTNAYTPIARTFPSWVSILTALHPLHSNAREDNANLSTIHYETTLPKLFKQAGYETVYASDDNRFNNINNYQFGFDRTIGPSGNALDFLFSALNDFPISNLLITSHLGKLLFPHNFANHASPHTYLPNNFIDLLNDGLNQSTHKPFFFAAHFNITAWPFHFFNDQQGNRTDKLPLYKNVITAADTQFGNFIQLLKDKGLLDHAIFVLISDHGITLQLPNDRIVSEARYQGDKNNIKLNRTAYRAFHLVIDPKKARDDNDEIKTIFIEQDASRSIVENALAIAQHAPSPFNASTHGLDTSWGYGNDILSLKQNRPLLAIQTFGMPKITPHHVAARCLLLDIGPTLLDMLNFAPIQHADGISLKNYLTHPTTNSLQQKPIFLETSFTTEELQRENMMVNKIIEESVTQFDINPHNALLSLTPQAIKTTIARKQRAILQGDWLLAFYPSSLRYKYINGHLEKYNQPPCAILVNLKTGQWTSEVHHNFALQSPYQKLLTEINHFYGQEMDNYISLP